MKINKKILAWIVSGICMLGAGVAGVNSDEIKGAICTGVGEAVGK